MDPILASEACKRSSSTRELTLSSPFDTLLRLLKQTQKIRKRRYVHVSVGVVCHAYMHNTYVFASEYANGFASE